MQGTPYEALVAYILSVDKSVLSYLLIIDALFSVAVVSLFSRNRRPLELVTMFGFSFVVLLAVATLIFHVGLDRPFFRLEIVRFP